MATADGALAAAVAAQPPGDLAESLRRLIDECLLPNVPPGALVRTVA